MGPVLRPAAVVLALCTVALAARVAGADGVPGDRSLLAAAALSGDSPWLRPALLVDRVTSNGGLAALGGLLVALLLRLRRRRAAWSTVVALGGALVGNPLLKRLVDRPRPELLPPLADVSPLSFPSGHAAGTAALAVALALALRGTRWAPAAAVAGLLLVVAGAASQLALARHYPSDLVGGWLWASAWTAAVWSDRPDRPGRG